MLLCINKIENAPTDGFLPGNSINATIYFTLEKEVSTKEIVANFSGVENSQVRYTVPGKTTDHRTAYASRNILQISIPIQANTIIQNGKIGPGSYAIPVELQLPGGVLPGSMSCSSGDGSLCNIQYTLTAQLKGSGWIQDYTATQEVIITALPLSDNPVPFNGQPILEKVAFCCCFNRGHMLFGARVSDTLISRGEAVTVSMSCRNRTTVPIDSITATFIEYIIWNANGHSSSQAMTLVSKNFSPFPGLERMQSLSLVNDTSPGQDMQDIARDLENAKNVATVIAPSTTRDTFTGSLISVRHVLSIVVHAGACITNPTIVIPIEAGPASAEGTTLPSNTSLTTPPQEEPDITFDFANAMTTSAVYVPSSHAVIGGAAYEKVDEAKEAAPLSNELRAPNLQNLFLDMSESINDFGMIQEKLTKADWQPIFHSLSPLDFGRIIQKVDLDFDHAKVAELLATAIHNFQCVHVIAAITTCSDWNRATIVEKTIPFCNDLALNKDKILNVLSEWDKLVTQKAFDTTLSQGNCG